MKSSALFSLLCAVTAITARERVIILPQGAKNTTVPEPTPISRIKRQTVENTPISIWNAATGDVDFNTKNGHIQHSLMGPDYHTIIKFGIPPQALGKNCQLHFKVGATDVNNFVQGAPAMFQVFRVQEPGPTTDGAWPALSQRLPLPGGTSVAPLGFLSAMPGGADAMGVVNIDPNPFVGSNLNLELAPISPGPNVNIAWDDAVSGPYLVC